MAAKKIVIKRVGKLVTRRCELTVSNESRFKGNKFLGVLISIGVLSFISTLIVAAILIANPDITNSLNGQRQSVAREAISLEEAMLGELAPNHFSSNWVGSKSAAMSQIPMERDELLYEHSRNIEILSLPTKLKFSNLNSNSTKSPLPFKEVDGQMLLNLERNVSILVSNSSLLVGSLDFQGFKVSPSKRYLLIWTSKRRQFRHSSTAMYFIYDIQQDMITQLSSASYKSPAPVGAADLPAGNAYQTIDSVAQRIGKARRRPLEKADDSHLADPSQFQLVNWFTLNQNDALFLIQANDVYLLTNLTQPAETMSKTSGELGEANDNLESNNKNNKLQMHRVSWDGKTGEIFNGIPDWLYEEEILADRPAYEFAPNGQRLAFMSFNDSLVEEMPFSLYGDSVIPKVRKIRYPKTGRVNPTVSVRIVEDLHKLQLRAEHEDDGQQQTRSLSSSAANPPINQARISQLQLPERLANKQHYITQIKWLTNEKLALIWLNRYQNESEIVICQSSLADAEAAAPAWPCKTNLRLSIENGWLDMSDELIPLNNDSYLTLLYRDYEPEVGAFKQVALVKINSTALDDSKGDYRFVTNTRSEVIAINGVDRARSLLYYTATPSGKPGQRQVYWTSLNDVNSNSNPDDNIDSPNSKNTELADNNKQCLTCDHYPNECLYNGAKFSPSTSYYVFECDGPGVPRIELRLNKLAQKAAYDDDLNKARSLNNTSSPTLISNSSTAEFQQDEAQFALSSVPELERLQQQQETESLMSGVSSNSFLIWTMEENKYLRDRLANQLAMPVSLRLSIPLPGTNYSASVVLLLPPQLGFRSIFRGPRNPGSGLDAAGSRLARSGARPRSRRAATLDGFGQSIEKYLTNETIGSYTSQLAAGEQFPMVVDVYAGPGTQTTDFRYKINFGHYLASSRRIIYCLIDGRGSGYQGTRRMFEVYRRLGSVEIEDQIDTVAQLTQKYSFIDASKVAVWGWSYGGYASAMILARSQQRQLQKEFLISQAKLATQQTGASTSTTAYNSTARTTSNASHLNPANEPHSTVLPDRLASLLLLESAASAGPNQQSAGRLRLPEVVVALSGGNSSADASNSKRPLTTLDQAQPQHQIQLQQLDQYQAGKGKQQASDATGAGRGVFECAASVAPVTNWLLYDTAYTERFMSSPYASELFDQFVPGDHSIHHNIVNFQFNSTGEPRTSTTANPNASARQAAAAAAADMADPKSSSSIQWTRFNQTKLHSIIYKMAISSGNNNIRQQQTMTTTNNNKQTNPHNNIINLNTLRSSDINARYRESSLLDRVGFIDRKRFLLIHGTADDNVHFQQSVMLMKRLIQSNVMFESRLYPDQDHSIGNRADKLHLASTLSNFFSECFDMAL